VVVTGSNKEKIDNELQQSGVIKVQNTNWQHGSGSSIRVGVQAFIDRVPSVDAIVLLVCDQPLVEADTIQRVITLHKNTNRSIVASSYAGTLGVSASSAVLFFVNCFRSSIKPALNRSFCEMATALRNSSFRKARSMSTGGKIGKT